jgi:hypothetical protein
MMRLDSYRAQEATAQRSTKQAERTTDQRPKTRPQQKVLIDINNGISLLLDSSTVVACSLRCAIRNNKSLHIAP